MIAIILMLMLTGTPALSGRAQPGNWRVYNGAWFKIKYPSNFKARPSQRSSSAQGYDSAFFTAMKTEMPRSRGGSPTALLAAMLIVFASLTIVSTLKTSGRS